MDIPAILKDEPHLPLSEGMLSSQAVGLCNMFYATSLNEGDFKKTQAFKDSDGKIRLELIHFNTGDVIVSFVNKAAATAAAQAEWVLDNPLMSAPDTFAWLGSPVAIHSADELEFLDEVGVGNTYPTEATDNTVAWKLAQLLNSYRFLGQWVSGTIGEQCAGGFKLVYKGVAEDAPDEFLLYGPDVVAVVQILHGSKQGYVCLRS
jgi:hypothetical protein